jgi:long-chain acyl-CoA synthetase
MEDTVVKVIQGVAKRQPESVALLWKDGSRKWQSISYRELVLLSSRFGAGLLELGVKRGDHIGLVSDNRKEWIIADQGILGIGAADVPRGSDTMPDEVRYILSHSDCAITLAENEEQVKKILSRSVGLPLLRTIIVMEEGFDPVKFAESTGGRALIPFRQIMEKGEAALSRDPNRFQREVDAGKAEEVATIIYTSGTTGEPKGVILTHGNFLHNLRTTVPGAIYVDNRDLFLSVLPVWHSFERTVEYIIFRNGCGLAYSKPIGKILLEDMAEVRPTVMASVPRIWEGVKAAVYRNINEEGGIKAALFRFFVMVGRARATAAALVKGLYPQFTKRYRLFDFLLGILPFLLLTPLHGLGQLLVFSKIKAKLGGRFRFTVSGGGALPQHVDKFFQAVGIKLLEGYGLTETAPIVSVRHEKHPVTGTIGPLLAEMEAKILDPDTGKTVGPGKKGVIFLKGPNVMKGYYKKPDKTAEVLSPDGWFDTGDLGMMTFKGELRILGRVKETIVLLGGENVEPVPIEDTILESEYIDQTMVVGQDQKFLAALVVLNDEAIERYAKECQAAFESKEALRESPLIQNLISREINSRVNAKRGFREFEQVFRFAVLPKHFEVGNELSAKQSVKRDVVYKSFKRQIDGLFAK